MGRPPKAPAMPEEPQVVDTTPKMVLKKSAGYIANGRTCHHFSAGTQFDSETDAATIAALIRAGAIFE